MRKRRVRAKERFCAHSLSLPPAHSSRGSGRAAMSTPTPGKVKRASVFSKSVKNLRLTRKAKSSSRLDETQQTVASLREDLAKAPE